MSESPTGICRPVANLRRGITLVEVAISTLLVGLVMVTSLRTMGSVMQTWQVSGEQTLAVNLAHELMAEIQQHAYQDPEEPGNDLGINTGELASDRTTFDDVDDYKNWSKSPPETRDGTQLTAYNGWNRSVEIKKVSNANANNIVNDNFNDQGVKRIRITVTDASSNVIAELFSIRSTSGGIEEPTALDATVVTAVDCQLQVGTVPQVGGSTSLSNHARDE